MTISVSTTPTIDDMHSIDHGPGQQSVDVTNLEAPNVKTALTNKQLKKKARKLKQAQKAKVAPGAISSDELGVSGTLTEAISHSRQSSMPALSDTVAPTISECRTSEDKVSLATGNERISKPSARNSSPDHGGQLLTQQMELGQRIEPVDMEFDALMAERRLQGIAAGAGIRQRADARDVPADANAPVSCLFQPSLPVSAEVLEISPLTACSSDAEKLQ